MASCTTWLRNTETERQGAPIDGRGALAFFTSHLEYSMSEILATEVKPGNIIRHFFQSDFGLHRIEGPVSSIEEQFLTGGRMFLYIVLREAHCSDVLLTSPGGAYLYGRDGSAMSPNYGLGVSPKSQVLLLATEATLERSANILPGAVPLRSYWTWEPKDSSVASTVQVTDYVEADNGPWVYFTSDSGSPWALDSDAFEEQCKFLSLWRDPSFPDSARRF